jgi:hypothetical protein
MSLVKDPDVSANGSSGSSYPIARRCRKEDAGGGANSDRSEESNVRWWRRHLVQQGVMKQCSAYLETKSDLRGCAYTRHCTRTLTIARRRLR